MVSKLPIVFKRTRILDCVSVWRAAVGGVTLNCQFVDRTKPTNSPSPYRFWLHYDNTDLASWQAIIRGAKRFFVCAPSETPYLSEIRLPRRGETALTNTGNSRINPFGARAARMQTPMHD